MDSGQSAPGQSATEHARKLRARANRLQVSADNYEKGAAGEIAVARVLGDLAAEFVVLHDLNIPGSKANVDHLVIGPTGVFMIDAKQWSGRLTAGADTLWRGTKPIRHECTTAAWEAQQISNAIGRPVQPIICFVETALPNAVQHCDGVTVCESDALLFLVRDGTRWLAPDAVAAIASVARPLVRTSEQHTTVIATACETQTMAMPIVDATASTPPRHGKSVRRRFGARPIYFRALPPVLALGMIVGAWALAPTLSRFVASSFSDSAPAGASPAPTGPASSSTTTSPEATEVGGPPTTATFLPPLIGFTCPTAGGGWMATASPSEFRNDPVGFTMWYLDAAGTWVSWGTFRSGVGGPAPFGPVPPGSTVEIKLDRGASLDAATAGQSLQATAPTDPC